MSASFLNVSARLWARPVMMMASYGQAIPSKPLRQALHSTVTCRGLSNTTLTQMHPSTHMIHRTQGILPCQWIIQEQRRGFASSSGSEEDEEEEFRDENGMTMKEREKIEKWAQNFSKDSIPKGLLTLNFVRSSGPGGQNVNKVNTKVDMRFVVDEAMWLPEYVRGRLKSEEGNKINKSGEYVLSSDSKRTQMANMDDCMEKLHAVLLRMAKLPTLPDAEALAKLERIRRAGDNRRKANKQFQSKKKAGRRISRDD
ncbi:MAG: translation release factor [Benniella sp.]|nr:MAG: translation release factor [Benniella sp.]